MILEFLFETSIQLYPLLQILLMLSEKGKYAAATENRRFVWAEIIWPLVLEINDITFSLKQFQEKRERE